jgi:hypothetical protein
MGIAMRQITTDGGHLLTGEADLADGHAIFEQVWQNITAEPEQPGDPPVVVDSTLVHIRVWLNTCLVRDPGLAQRLWQEAIR